MNHLGRSEATSHSYYNDTVHVTEFDFQDDTAINDAEIILTARYPETGYAVNDISLALVSIESGEGSIVVRGFETQPLVPGDRVLIKPGEPYYFMTIEKLAIRYIATPAWTPKQARIIEDRF